MIGVSVPEYAFIRLCIWGLRSITPLSGIYLATLLYFRPRLPWYLHAITVWASAEIIFYPFVYLPRKAYLERPITHPPLPSPSKRRELYERCRATITQPHHYISKWFKDAPMSEIKRDNIKDFMLWSFFNSAPHTDQYFDEMEEYVQGFEEVLGQPFPQGRGSASPIRLTVDPIRMMHRTLFWYSLVGFVDIWNHGWFLYYQFEFYRCKLSWIPQVFPLRPQTLLAKNISTSPSISYWYKPHTSRTKRPILFLHGIGIGLIPYIPYLEQITRREPDDDGQVGCIIVEMLPISFRITKPSLPRAQFLREMATVLKAHPEFDDGFVVASHSYGSVVTTWLLQYTPISSRISSVILIDPVTILLHLPDVAYNFTFRKPRSANEFQLWYFASMDPDVAYSLARRFFWSENIIWKEDLQAFIDGDPKSIRSSSQRSSPSTSGTSSPRSNGHLGNGKTPQATIRSADPETSQRNRKVAIFLGGRDLIVNTPAVWQYLTDMSRDEVQDTRHYHNKSGNLSHGADEWCSSGSGDLSVHWAGELDHAQVFDVPHRLAGLVEKTKQLLERD